MTLKLLLDAQCSVRVPNTSTHVFACPPNSYFNGYRTGNKMEKMCSGLKHPDHITSTNIKKNIASLSQVINLEENEMDILASHIGHDIRVHREYYMYRLPQDVLETAMVGKLLVMMERGALHEATGNPEPTAEVNKVGL
ncbi:hypothetical protein ElyMa_001322100 [Elysia marginata]|uniref:Uncharacterized protein n=1 Tax=Elysia marginata TaxID=1093978 RepID=A0AAV4ILW3_9GAST|nr:hypothetical protein ElyMa_001322100 [Elysia marginata]